MLLQAFGTIDDIGSIDIARTNSDNERMVCFFYRRFEATMFQYAFFKVCISEPNGIKIKLHVHSLCNANLKNPNKTSKSIFRDVMRSLVKDQTTWMNGSNRKIREAYPKEVEAVFGKLGYLISRLTILL